MNAVASTTPPWNPPDGLVWACKARYHPITTVGPMRISATMPHGVAGRPRVPAHRLVRAARSRSPRRWRSTVLTPTAATNRMNSSPTVSNPRYSKLIADTTPVALVCADRDVG